MAFSRIYGFFFPEEVDFFGPMDTMYRLIDETLHVYIESATKQNLSPFDREKLLTDLKALERKGDLVVQEVTSGLKRSFTPPFSPLELRRLFSCLDDALDNLYESAMMNITAEYRGGLPPFVLEQLMTFQRGIALASKTVDQLRQSRQGTSELATTLTAMCDMEMEGDKIYWRWKKEISAVLNRAALGGDLAAYRRAEMDEKILDQLEDLLDSLVGMMKVIQGMIIEHA
ncbi:MAG: DUF47 family protein [Nitrospinota bacterium]|nr:DUF47 family protein [Nitrospinota bacterium]